MNILDYILSNKKKIILCVIGAFVLYYLLWSFITSNHFRPYYENKSDYTFDNNKCKYEFEVEFPKFPHSNGMLVVKDVSEKFDNEVRNGYYLWITNDLGNDLEIVFEIKRTEGTIAYHNTTSLCKIELDKNMNAKEKYYQHYVDENKAVLEKLFKEAEKAFGINFNEFDIK